MYALGEEFCVMWNSKYSPTKAFSRNAEFWNSGNACYARTRCTIVRKFIQVEFILMETLQVGDPLYLFSKKVAEELGP